MLAAERRGMSVSVISRLAHVSLALLLLAVLPISRARACWDGHLAIVGDAMLFDTTDDRWSATRARDLAKWLTRIDALLDEGESFVVEHGVASVCAPDGTCQEWVPARSLPTLFAEVAAVTAAPAAEIAHARAIDARPLTLQAASFTDRARADALAARIDSDVAIEHGFYEAGGFPADNPVARVAEADVDGHRVYRVLVGTYLDSTAAAETRARLATELGLTAQLRPL
jgi:hypothetical protein